MIKAKAIKPFYGTGHGMVTRGSVREYGDYEAKELIKRGLIVPESDKVMAEKKPCTPDNGLEEIAASLPVAPRPQKKKRSTRGKKRAS